MLFLISNWKTILGVIATASIAWMLHSLDVNRIEAAQREALAEQVKVDTNVCNADKAITEGVSNDYQKKVTDLGNQLAALKLREPSRCISVSPAKPSCRGNASPKSSEPSGTDGVTSYALYDYASDAEKYRIQLISCQDFISKTWASNGQ